MTDTTITLETVGLEFSAAYAQPISRLIMDKLTLAEENQQLKAEVTMLKRELDLKKSNHVQPKRIVEWDDNSIEDEPLIREEREARMEKSRLAKENYNQRNEVT